MYMLRAPSCSIDPYLAYQSIHHQVLSHSNGKICHWSIKLMDSWVISTLYCWRCAWDSALNNIDVSMKIWTCPILLLHWRNFKQILWWIQIKFIWWENLLTFVEIVVSRRVSDEPTSLSFHCHWYEQVFWWLNYQLPMWIGRFIAYLNPKLLALVWVYQWFFHPVSKPRALSKLQYYHLPWIKRQNRNTCAYRYINPFCIFWEEWRHSALLLSEWNW